MEKKKKGWMPRAWGTLVLLCLLVMTALVVDGRAGGVSQYVEREPAPLESPREESAAPGLMDLNTADWETLATLPGIGEVLAKRIIAYREQVCPFVAKEQIMDVEGIGQVRYENMKDLITVGK